MKSRTGYNPKRRLAAPADLGGVDLGALADACTYTGNAEHKSDPGDFGLAPPYGPREGKTLCDAAGITRKADATRLLREGIRKGIVSRQRRGAWPQNVWAVLEDTPLEGQL